MNNDDIRKEFNETFGEKNTPPVEPYRVVQNNDNSFEVFNDTLVSMNMIIFTPKIFEYIEKKFVEFFDKNKENMEKAEFLIPNKVPSPCLSIMGF